MKIKTKAEIITEYEGQLSYHYKQNQKLSIDLAIERAKFEGINYIVKLIDSYLKTK